MYSTITMIVTLIQLAVVLGSYALGMQELFTLVTIYGSPIYLVMNMLNADSAWVAKNPVYLMMFAYHIIKYALFFRARLSEGGSFRLTAAIVFEAAYLCISGYYAV
jgi:hypothetical protein